MAKLLDYVKSGFEKSSMNLIIEQKLNKLFYCSEVPKQELEMIRMQYAQKVGDRFGLHASAILSSDNEFCIREQVLSLFFKQSQGENISIGLKRIFEAGTAIGEKWQRLFLRGGIGKPDWMDISQFKEEYDLSFTPDAVIKIGKKKYIVEIKSQNTFIFKKQKGHPSGERQCLLYMHLTDIHEGFVLVEDKNNQEFKVIPVPYDAKKLAPYIERLEAIQVAKNKVLKTKKTPKKKCDSSKCKRALKCNMRDACFDTGIGRIKL